MLDVVDRRRQRALGERHDSAAHLVWRKARVVPDDADDRNVDAREDVGRRGDDDADAGDHDEDCQDREGIRPA